MNKNLLCLFAVESSKGYLFSACLFDKIDQGTLLYLKMLLISVRHSLFPYILLIGSNILQFEISSS